MPKIGLFTFYHIHHYGAVLQAAALQKIVERFGNTCEIIDYYVNQDNSLLQFPKKLSTAVSDIHTTLHYPAFRTRYQRFEEFKKEQLHITNKYYANIEELKKADLPYDVLLFGSDQIWNPFIFPNQEFDPVFFGAFSKKRKISYAPSFGAAHFSDQMNEELHKYLSVFSHISVREKTGQDIVKEILGREAPIVLDPTLLITAGEWATITASPVIKPGYILCYYLSNSGALTLYAEALSKKTGLPIVQLCGMRKKISPSARMILDAGPAEFLSLFYNASYVCTNSFHGTVFSLQFQKPFFTIISSSEMNNPEHSRVFSILDRLGISNRIIGRGDSAQLDTPIDWAAISEKLDLDRTISLEYLEAALTGHPYMVHTKASEKKRVVPRLASQEHCTGCTACESICEKKAISMKRNLDGFAYPIVNSATCIHCGRCTAVCPVLHPREERDTPAIFAAWNENDEIRLDSSSGGVFSALAEYVLEENGVVFGAAMDSRQHVSHIACFRKEDLWRFRGAKYVQSDLSDSFSTVKWALKNRCVLFSGTPCQIDGLYHYLGERPENLITCDLVCHGVPSPGVWEDMADALRRDKSMALRTVHFRDKEQEKGWTRSHFTLIYDDGTKVSAPLYETEYGRAFGRSLFLRPCCHHCAYANLNRPGDFTLGDFWGLKEEEFPEERTKGISLLMINTPRASHIFDQLSIVRHSFSAERAIAGNPNLASPTPCPAERATFFAAYALLPFKEVRHRYLPPPSAIKILAGRAILANKAFITRTAKTLPDLRQAGGTIRDKLRNPKNK